MFAAILVSMFGLGLSAVHAAVLPDTGQDKCYDGAALVACTSTNTGDGGATYRRQDGRFGRDAKAAAGALTKSTQGLGCFNAGQPP